jgi:integrase
MKGARDLSDEEIDTLKDYFNNADTSLPENKHLLRDKVFMWLGFYTGWRAGELLQIKIKDIWDGKRITDYISIKKSAVKGKTAGKSAPIYDDCKKLLENYILTHCDGFEYLFQSSQGGPLGYRQILRCVKKHLIGAGFTGNLSTHLLRKTFSRKMYKALDGSLVDLQACLGHKQISSTVSYVSVNKEKITGVIKNMKF